jgi:hypothetical protein
VSGGTAELAEIGSTVLIGGRNLIGEIAPNLGTFLSESSAQVVEVQNDGSVVGVHDVTSSHCQ